jgi:PKD repeat protein
MKRLTFLLLSLTLLAIRTACSQDTLILQPGPEGKDALICDYYTANYGDYTNMFAQTGTTGGDYFITRSLIEFDLSSIPPSADILEARLSLYFANNPPNPHYQTNNNTSYLQRVINPWDEYTVTWYNQPEVTTQNQVRLAASQSSTQDYTDINVKILIQEMVNDPESNFGILFRLETEDLYDRRMFFASGDHENPLLRPKLEIIYKVCELPAALFTFSIDQQTVNFSGISATADSWSWDFGDGYLSNLQNPIHEYQEQGYYEVCLTVEDSCGTGQYCETLQLCDMPSAGFAYLSDGLNVHFQDTSRFSDHYFWTFGDGYYSDLPEPRHTYDTAGYYWVCMETGNVCGADTVCQVIFVDYSSIDKLENSSFSIYPNPASNAICIRSAFIGPLIISLVDLSGKEVMRQSLVLKGDDIIDLALDQIEPGLYIVRLDSGNNQAYSKLVVSR